MWLRSYVAAARFAATTDRCLYHVLNYAKCNGQTMKRELWPIKDIKIFVHLATSEVLLSTLQLAIGFVEIFLKLVKNISINLWTFFLK